MTEERTRPFVLSCVTSTRQWTILSTRCASTSLHQDMQQDAIIVTTTGVRCSTHLRFRLDFWQNLDLSKNAVQSPEEAQGGLQKWLQRRGIF